MRPSNGERKQYHPIQSEARFKFFTFPTLNQTIYTEDSWYTTTLDSTETVKGPNTT